MLSVPSLPGDGNNWRQNCFRDCGRRRNEGWENFSDICFCSSSTVSRLICASWRVKLLCYFTSSLMLTQKPFTAWRVVGLAPLRRGEKKEKALSFHQCPTTQDWVKIFASFSTSIPPDHIPRVCSLFIIQRYCFTHLSKGKVATSS